MADIPHKVILSGIKPGQDPAAVRERLAAIFRQDPARVRQLLDSAPVTLSKDSSAAKARKLRDAIRAAGAVCRTEPPLPNSPAPNTPPPPERPILKRCPKCGYAATHEDDPLLTGFEGQGECPKCGVIPTKFAAAAQAMPRLELPTQQGPLAPLTQQPGRTGRRQPDWRGARLAFFTLLIVGLPGLAIWQMLAFLNNQTPAPSVDSASPGFEHPRATQATTAANTSQTEVEAIHQRIQDDGRAKFALAPGQTGQFVLKTWLPLMHSEEFLPLSFTPDSYEAMVVAISDDADVPEDEQLRAAWQRLGIKPADMPARVEIQNVRIEIASERIPLRERLVSVDAGWKLDGMSPYWGVRPVSNHPKPSALLSVNRPFDLIETIRHSAAEPVDSNLTMRQRHYLFYGVSLHFSLRAPENPTATEAIIMAAAPRIAFHADGDTRRLLDSDLPIQGGLLRSADNRWMLGLLPMSVLRLTHAKDTDTWQLRLDDKITNEQWRLETTP
ncbi:hypothetical protein Thiowin_02032 [Thiorhodovibrio winogradskyi]|uniref:Uncharacterized protein n=1 Tax=Thiorhodovibrio winogradskyi TaxID=77007 RepID=A0ABZ0S7U7_9GAMM|nr:hypothetical protein [Thiorhodovibrio winogradskyi]